MCAVALLINNTMQHNTIQYNKTSFHSRGPCSGSRQRIVRVLNLVQRRDYGLDHPEYPLMIQSIRSSFQ
jgi:hypothetical protein